MTRERPTPETHTEAEPLDAPRFYTGLRAFTVEGFTRGQLVYEKVIAAKTAVEAESIAASTCTIAVEAFQATPFKAAEVI